MDHGAGLDHAWSTISRPPTSTDELLGLFGIERRLLPRLAPSEAVAGSLDGRGRRADGLARRPAGRGRHRRRFLDAARAAACVAAGHRRLCWARPRWWAPSIRGRSSTRPGWSRPIAMPARGLLHRESRLALAAARSNWLRALRLIADFAALRSSWRPRRRRAPMGVTFLPALTGAMTPEWIAGARGCFYGLTPSHGAGHLARAALEGMRLRACATWSSGCARWASHRVACASSAAAPRSRLWAQIRADVTGLPVERSRGVRQLGGRAPPCWRPWRPGGVRDAGGGRRRRRRGRRRDRAAGGACAASTTTPMAATAGCSSR